MSEGIYAQGGMIRSRESGYRVMLGEDKPELVVPLNRFSVADHLDDRTQAQLLELAKHATIGSPDSGTGDVETQ